jgi:transcriptional regulator with XRE-family HTH domain
MAAKAKPDRGNLPQALILLRRRLKLKQNALARRLGARPGRLSQYERGYTEPDFATLRWLLAGMGFDLHDLQDALDAVEGRPPRGTGEPGLKPPMDYLTGLLRLFAMMVARELQTQAPPATLKPRTRRVARSSRGKKLVRED